MESIINYIIKNLGTGVLQNNWVLILIVVLLVAIPLIIKTFANNLYYDTKNYIFKFFKILRIKLKPSHDIKSRFTSTVYEELIGARKIMNADIAFIWEFHNGSVFASGNPIWKITQTYFNASKNYKNDNPPKDLIVSLIWDFINVFLYDKKDNLPDGISILETKNKCPLKGNKCTLKNHIYRINVEELEDSKIKNIFLDYGVSNLVLTCLSKYRQPIGILGIAYSSEIEFENYIKEDTFTTCELCKVSETITNL